MNFIQVIKQDVWFYRRANLVMLLLAAVCCAVLTGAMLVGDSVKHTLRSMAQKRLGKTQFVMSTGDRFFRQSLAAQFKERITADAAPVLALRGILESPDGSVRINNINVYGIDERFGLLNNTSFPLLKHGIADDGRVWVSQSVEARLGKTQKNLLLRLKQNTKLSSDLIFSIEDAASSSAWEVSVSGTIADDSLGRFSLQAAQEPPLNVFVPIDWLSQKVGIAGKANMLLVGTDGKNHPTQQELSSALKKVITLDDLGLEIRRIDAEDVFEVRSPRIFLDEPIAEAGLETGENPYGIFTYFVNEIRSGKKSVPYSTVSAAEKGVLSDLKSDQIIINEWLADELDADKGDSIELTYFKLAPTRMLVEQTRHFTVRQVVPMMGSFADPTLMPDYPGLTDADSCGDWDSGIPIDLKKIRDRDEDYWDKYRGTPKAFISMEAAQTIWSNRFGTLTSVRWPCTENDSETITSDLIKNLDLSQVAYTFEDVRAAAHRKASGSTDFAGLFAGLSMFLIFSAAILLALMFVFYIESRTEQAGLLLAVGWNHWRVFALFLAEGACVALAGCLLGAILSVFYTGTLIVLLNTSFWTKSLASLQLAFYISPVTLVVGIFISFLICVFAIQASLYHRLRRPVHQLLTGIAEPYSRMSKFRSRLLILTGLVCLSAGIIISVISDLDQGQVAQFFTAGTLWMVGLILIAAGWLRWLRLKSRSFVNSLNTLAIKSIPRRTGRSIAVLVALACGVFMVIGVGASYKDVGADVHQRHSGTGGFALLGHTTLPVTEPIELEDASFVPMRVYQQDDASCLNLNKAQQPTLLGVRPDDLAKRDAFVFQRADLKKEGGSAWNLLETMDDENTIPAIGDYATVYWGLGKNLGDSIAYRTETGQTVYLKMVGILEESTVQGRLIISEDNFVRCFPSVDGYQQFFIDTDWQNKNRQAEQLMKKYRDVGLEVVSSEQVLAQYHEVENTYLAIFLILGGLGLVLGSAGLGLVVVLNVIDRRGELAMMQAVGFRKSALKTMLFAEHGFLLLAGLFCGALPALWAVLPSIMTRGARFPYVQIMLIIVAIIISGALWIRFAATRILKSDFMNILRNE